VSELEKDAGRRETPAHDENEVLRASRLASALRDAAAQRVGRVGWKTAAGLGVGSAAIIAALLYAKSGRK
jgi:hypothetical protein